MTIPHKEGGPLFVPQMSRMRLARRYFNGRHGDAC